MLVTIFPLVAFCIVNFLWVAFIKVVNFYRTAIIICGKLYVVWPNFAVYLVLAERAYFSTTVFTFYIIYLNHRQIYELGHFFLHFSSSS